ncbi:MAG: NACHT domain-containing protein [Proteobacteria bacterium]|nr:NACHT domain-containing protein [Pseudomonadota bacterium]
MSRKDGIKRLIINHSRRLQKLKEQEALHGFSVDPRIPLEIEDLETKIERLQAELEEIEQISDATTTSSLSEEAFNQRNQTRLLEKVEVFWVKRVLKGSLHGRMLIELGLEYRPQAVERSWDTVLQYANQANPTLLPSGQKVIDVFDEAGGKLLILGEPGSGKTTTLLALARDLIDCAKQDRTMPIPVVFNLSSWTETQNTIADWLVGELFDKYQIPQRIGQAWVDYDCLLLLLDGLDEVRRECRAECVDAINHFRQDHDLVKMVVCSRSADYEPLASHLRLDDAVALQSLTSAQINDYLSGFDGQLAELHKLFQKDQVLQELARSPLLLGIMTIAYQGTSIDSIPMSSSTKERHKHLLDTYVARMFERRGPDKRFTHQQTFHWLHWLAQKMSEQGQSLFLIEKVQPDWLLPSQRRLYDVGIRLTVGLVVGFIFGLAVGMSASPVFGPGFGLIAGITFGVAWGLAGWLTFERALSWGTVVVGIAFGVAWGVAGWLAFGVLAALVFGLIGVLVGSLSFGVGVSRIQDIKSIGTPDKIVIVEILKWSWAKARLSLLLWIILGLPIGLGIGVPVWLTTGPIAGWAYGIATTLAFVMTFGLAGGLTSGEIETKTVPNQGIWRSRRNANLIGGAFGIIIALVFGLSFAIAFGPISGLTGGIAVGIAGWLIGWLIFGGLTYTQHLWLRIILSINKCIPWDYASFLDYAAERILLQKVGGGYIFIHRILLDYFACTGREEHPFGRQAKWK